LQRSNTTKGSTAWLEQSRPTHESHTHTQNTRSVPDLTDGQHPTSILRGTGTPSNQLAVVEQPTRLKDPKYTEREKNFETYYRSV